MTIGQILKKLPPSEYDTLMVAFEEGITGYYEYVPGRFVGVNTDSVPHLICEQEAGLWREGRIKYEQLQAAAH